MKMVALILSGPEEKMKVLSGLRVAKRIHELEGQCKIVFLADGVRVPLDGASDPDLAKALEEVRGLEPTVCKGILEQMGAKIDLAGYSVDYVGPVLGKALQEGFQIVSF